MDIQQAFDRVWHAGLLHKLKRLLNPQLYLIIKSFRSFKVVQDGVSSQPKKIIAAVPQGSVLWPTLYNVYTFDTDPNDLLIRP